MTDRPDEMATTIEVDTWLHDGNREAVAKRVSSTLLKQGLGDTQGYIISARSTGWGDCLLSLVSAWYHAKVSSKTLIIDWRSSLYLGDPKLNAFAYYFQPCSHIAGVPVICQDPLDDVKLSGPVYSPIWEQYSSCARLRGYQERVFHEDIAGNHLSKNKNSSTVIYQACLLWAIEYKSLSRHVLENIHLKPSIQSQIDGFIKQNFRNKMIGVHLRCGNQGNIMDHTSYWQDQPLATKRVYNAIDAALEKFGSDCGLFVCTDTKEFLITTHPKLSLSNFSDIGGVLSAA